LIEFEIHSYPSKEVWILILADRIQRAILRDLALRVNWKSEYQPDPHPLLQIYSIGWDLAPEYPIRIHAENESVPKSFVY
jgi:hypothetical protein